MLDQEEARLYFAAFCRVPMSPCISQVRAHGLTSTAISSRRRCRSWIGASKLYSVSMCLNLSMTHIGCLLSV